MVVKSSRVEKELPQTTRRLQTTLQTRFEKNMGRHPGLGRANMQAWLVARPDKLWSLAEIRRVSLRRSPSFSRSAAL